MKREVQRKAVHTLLALLCAWGIVHIGYTGIVYATFLLLALFLIVRYWVHLPGVTHLFRSTYGELFFVLGILASLFLSYPDMYPFQIAMMVLGLADTSASLVGMTFGNTHQYKLFGEKRTVHGSLACFAVTYGVALFFGVPYLIGLCLAGCVGVVEALSPRGSDNFFIPTVAVLLLVVLG